MPQTVVSADGVNYSPVHPSSSDFKYFSALLNESFWVQAKPWLVGQTNFNGVFYDDGL